MKKTCVFCNPEDFGNRKLRLEDQNGYWYSIVPKEIGTFGQVLLVAKKKPEDGRHITDISDSLLLKDPSRLQSIMKGISIISNKLKEGLKDSQGRIVEKVYVLTQCEGKESHLHFQFFPRYKGDLERNMFLYNCELEEARWQDPPELKPETRIMEGRRILKKYDQLLKENQFFYHIDYRSKVTDDTVKELNRVLTQ